MTIEIVKQQTLTPAQFTVARALAGAYGHLWAGVPDNTYNPLEILEWSEEEQTPGLPGGIYTPDLVPDFLEYYKVVHITGSGRLQWEVNNFGHVTLSVFRPAGKVASVNLINDADDTEKEYRLLEDCTIQTSDLTLSQKYEPVETSPYVNYIDNFVRDDLLCERHVHALVRPIVTLLTAHLPEYPAFEYPDREITDQEREEMDAAAKEMYQEYRETYIQPAIDKAKMWLMPLYEIALPDPIIPSAYESVITEYPGTCWIQYRQEPWDTGSVLRSVKHGDETFPVESEKTAIHAVLLLRKNPEMALIDAIKLAIVSESYRPEA